MKIGLLSGASGHTYLALDTTGRAVTLAGLDRDGIPAVTRNAVRELQERPSAAALAALLPSLPALWQEHAPKLPSIQISLDRLQPPVMPRNFVCVGLNYADHVKESKAEKPKQPLLFAKTGNAVTGHGHVIRLPRTSREVDFEAELAVVIGRTCRGVSAATALDHVAGYTCCNDISARDYQFGDGQWYRGKSADGFGPLGPWLVTPDEVGDPHALRICFRLNGQTLQDSSTNQLIFRIPELIAYISQSITLEPGDVISTGTPPGAGFARTPPVFLQPGDRMEGEIEKLGTLVNTCTQEN